MTTETPSTRQRPYIGAHNVNFLASAVVVIGLIWAVGGIAYMINAGTQTTADVTIDVVASQELTERVTEDSARALQTGETGVVPSLSVGDLRLAVWDSTLLEQLLSRGGAALIGVAVLAGALLLRPLLLSIAEGRPFDSGNHRRLAWLAAVAAVAMFCAQLPGLLATRLVLDRADLGQIDSLVSAGGIEISAANIVVPIVFLLVAEAFRRGAQLVDDVAGLV